MESGANPPTIRPGRWPRIRAALFAALAVAIAGRIIWTGLDERAPHGRLSRRDAIDIARRLCEPASIPGTRLAVTACPTETVDTSGRLHHFWNIAFASPGGPELAHAILDADDAIPMALAWNVSGDMPSAGPPIRDRSTALARARTILAWCGLPAGGYGGGWVRRASDGSWIVRLRDSRSAALLRIAWDTGRLSQLSLFRHSPR